MQELSRQAQDSQYLYVYGIVPVKNNMKFEFSGLREKPLRVIPYLDIAAVVSSYPVLKPLVNESDAMQHTEILKRLTMKTTVIPLSFGNVFRDEATLNTVLGKAYNAVKESLELIKGKIELGVKVVKGDIDADYNDHTTKILAFLKSLCVKASRGDNFSNRLLLNYSFLVERAKFSKFSNAIAKLEKQYKNLKFIYTGPWPPYSFITISIRGENVHT